MTEIEQREIYVSIKYAQKTNDKKKAFEIIGRQSLYARMKSHTWAQMTIAQKKKK